MVGWEGRLPWKDQGKVGGEKGSLRRGRLRMAEGEGRLAW